MFISWQQTQDSQREKWYVDRATKLLDRLTAMQPDNEVFQVVMTTYLLSCLTKGASDEFQLKLKYEEPTTMVQAQEIAQKVDKVLFDPAIRKILDSKEGYFNNNKIINTQIE